MKNLEDSVVADFETTTDENDCRVWCWAYCKVFDPSYFRPGITIAEFCDSIKHYETVFFHNLAFDGQFILSYIMNNGYSWTEKANKKKTFSTLISDLGKFYSIEVVWDNGSHTIFYDSLKKLPMSVKNVAISFGFDEGKGEIDYRATRSVGYRPTWEELDYIRRDVQIVAKALAQAISEGMTAMTVASDSMHEYRSLISRKRFNFLFPELDIDVDDAVRGAYRGGFTYADPRYSRRKLGDGIVLDVNSLYPYIMASELLPYGPPEFFHGAPSPTDDYPLFIAIITFTAKIKPDHIPCIQVKSGGFFLPTEYLTEINDPVTMAVTSTDLELWEQQYDLDILSCDGGYRFRAAHGLFAEYIEKWSTIKANSIGGKRQIAKLHLNSLYGKFATNPHIFSKYPVMGDDGVVKLVELPEELRKPVYTPMAAFITAGARRKTITAAQANYDRFCYADTDSLHLMGQELPDLDIHDSNLGAWKIESRFTDAVFLRAKAYGERIDGRDVLHVAGMPSSVAEGLTLDDLLRGGTVGGKLVPKRVPGGVVLRETTYTIK